MEGVKKNKIVAYRSFNSLFEANVVKELLASNDIPSMIKNDQAQILMPMFSSTSGITLMVFEKDLPRVKEIVEGGNEDPTNKDNNQ